MTGKPERYTVRVHQEPGQELWAEVLELPGCFATGTDMEDLRQALTEATGAHRGHQPLPVQPRHRSAR